MTTKSGKRLRALEGTRTSFTLAGGRVVEGGVESRGVPETEHRYFFVTSFGEYPLHANYSRRHDRTRVLDGRLFETKEQLEKYRSGK